MKYKDIFEHLSKGMPVIVSLSKDNREGNEDKRYTNYAHYSLLIGVTNNGKNAYLLDSGQNYLDIYIYGIFLTIFQEQKIILILVLYGMDGLMQGDILKSKCKDKKNY